ncbi:MAG: META domain-containing protein [Flavobacteriales bacterium]|nr:META domain-containing protein [Flavobacteriales bacterium]
MKKTSLALALFTVLSAYTWKKGNDTAVTVADIAGKQCTLQSLAGKDIAMPEGKQAPWLKGDAESSRLEGFGGCNQLMGSFKMDGSNISFPGLGGTKMMCPDVQEVENGFKTALSQATSYKLDGSTLKLLNGGTELAALVAK